MYLFLVFCTFIFAILFFAKNRFYAYLFLVPLSVFSQSATLFSTGARGVNIGLDTIFIFIVLLLELYLVLSSPNTITSYKINNTIFYLLLCFFYLFINSVVYLCFHSGTISGILTFIKLFQYIPILIILSRIEIKIENIRYVILTFIWTGIIASILAFVQKLQGEYSYMKGMPSFTAPVFRESGFVEVGKMYTGSGNYNVFAAFMLIPILLSLLILLNRKNKIFFENKFIIFSLVLLLIGLFLAKSRIAIVALIFAIIYLGFAKSVISLLKWGIIVFLLLAAVLVFYSNNAFVKSFTEVLTHFNDALPSVIANKPWNSSMGLSGDAYGAISRIDAYLEALKVFLRFPVFGCGLNMILTQTYRYPENLFLQILAETGIVGLLLYTIFLISIYKSTTKILRQTPFNVNFMIVMRAIFFAMIIVNLTGAIFIVQKVWGPFLLIMGFYYGYIRSENSKLQNE